MEEKQKKIPLVAVVGPTASGKTGLAVELALRLNGEVVSADSMQIYKRMEIATAKPTPAERKGIPHHLMDFLEPDAATFSVADYVKLAHEAIADIAGRGKLPILAGGTGLYIDAVVENIDYGGTKAGDALRTELVARLEEQGGAALLEELRAVDPVCAAALHPNNRWRILRALEGYRLTGLCAERRQQLSRQAPSRYECCLLGLNFTDRALLYDRINRRVDVMMETGLLEEAREISRIYGGTARQAIGYKELQPYLDGLLPLEVCVDRLKQMTRHYAKRQLTWFTKNEKIHWLMVDQAQNCGELAEKAENIIHKTIIL